MGLMDNIKNAQDMAQQAMQNAQQTGGAAGAGMPDAADAAYANLAMKLNSSGLPGVATINSVSETGKTDGVSKQFALECSVVLESGDSYDTTVLQSLHDQAVAAYVPGKRFEIKVDPEDKTQGMLYGEA